MINTNKNTGDNNKGETAKRLKDYKNCEQYKHKDSPKMAFNKI